MDGFQPYDDAFIVLRSDPIGCDRFTNILLLTLSLANDLISSCHQNEQVTDSVVVVSNKSPVTH